MEDKKIEDSSKSKEVVKEVKQEVFPQLRPPAEWMKL